jgi:hypothetical protein
MVFLTTLNRNSRSCNLPVGQLRAACCCWFSICVQCRHTHTQWIMSGASQVFEPQKSAGRIFLSFSSPKTFSFSFSFCCVCVNFVLSFFDTMSEPPDRSCIFLKHLFEALALTSFFNSRIFLFERATFLLVTDLLKICGNEVILFCSDL